jgi:L-lysine 2,3-aminomutase
MDYDHVPEKGEKIKSVTRMLLDNTPKEIILEEIKKCDLVCLLCHNKRTYDRFNEKLGEERKYRPHQIRNINIINEFKNKPCNICGIQYETYNMQLDHIDPLTKLYDVCSLKNYKEITLLTELAKCQVLCALCHRKKSIEEQQNDQYIIERQQPPKRVELFYDPFTYIKECGLCHELKDGNEFRLNSKTKSGLDTYCKECFNEYRRKRRNK